MCGAKPLPHAARCQIRSSAGYAETECGKHDLRVSPGVAPAGFQEMSPAFALDFASRGDAVTGINRADSASVKLNSILCDSARVGNSVLHLATPHSCLYDKAIRA